MLSMYAPWVYIHPDEELYPSSVMWFFEHGARLHRPGKKTERIIKSGDNLPSEGGADSSYLDLPPGRRHKKTAKRGFLSCAVTYVHAKPAVNGSCTDLALWVYYPYNGSSKFLLGPFVIGLGQIGEHVEDWEHFTLRIDNGSGKLMSVYLSQHSKGEWLSPDKFELWNGTIPVIYASLHSHAYSSPNSYMHLQGNADPRDSQTLMDAARRQEGPDSYEITDDNSVGFGILDETLKSNNVIDLATAMDIVYIDQFDHVMVPWLNYTGRWGPKITYNFAEELLNITSVLPDDVKDIAVKYLCKLVPSELLKQQGPQGPKMKHSWSGDKTV